MKRSIVICALAVLVSLPGRCQNRGEVGAFIDYTRIAAIPQDEMGAGGRVSLNFRPHLALEVEGAYDFARTHTIIVTPSPGITNTSISTLRLISLLAGPSLQSKQKGPFRVFVFAKAGVLRFGTNRGPATFGNRGVLDFTHGGNYNAAVYPGGGLELFIGRIGLRLDLGDEIYIDNGAHSNLRMTFGPHFRF